MDTWKKTGFIATLVIVLSIPIYMINQFLKDRSAFEDNTPFFTGREKCIECHQKEYNLWIGSHHDKAMDVATDSTVLGDFDNYEFIYKGAISRFYKKENKFFVYTNGPGGEMAEYEITHTFGYTPLQQYLVPFPGGCYQCLPIAWDTENEKWFNMSAMIYSGEEIKPDDWLYWTNLGQNWNGMCAECHSTNLQKNYDHQQETFNTTWSEIDVSCEACHGPGSSHIDWANLPEMTRPQNVNADLVIQTSDIESKQQVELCASCHSRRSSLDNNDHTKQTMMDLYIPQNLAEPIYFIDGQIREEDYVYGSFTQSKMYMKDVKCADCHDVHSGKLIKEGNALCLQCHQSNIYDSFNHHFHKYKGEAGDPVVVDNGAKRIEVGEGALCVNCHMPGRFYMGIDFRNDHSMRIPRPDLSIKLGTPNACNQCHSDKSVKWSSDWYSKWYGLSRKPHFGEVFASSSKTDSQSLNELSRIIKDPLYPAIVRATAVELLSAYPIKKTESIYNYALNDDAPIIRYYALLNFSVENPKNFVKIVAPFLKDPIKAVRITSAQRLSSGFEEYLNEKQMQVYKQTIDEYIFAQEYAADFTSARHNLGILYTNLGRIKEAAKQYEAAIKIDNQFLPPKVNLAIVYNKLGENNKAVALYKDIIEKEKDFFEAYYSLGLLLAEEKDYEQSAKYLKIAVNKMPFRPRIHYNLGLLLQILQKQDEAESSLLKAQKLEPDNFDYLYALADHYIKRKEKNKAKIIVMKIIEKFPDNPAGQSLLNYINNLGN